MFTKAIVRIPGANFDAGLTTVSLGRPNFDQVLTQHAAYCQALVECGLTLTALDPLIYPNASWPSSASKLPFPFLNECALVVGADPNIAEHHLTRFRFWIRIPNSITPNDSLRILYMCTVYYNKYNGEIKC